MWRRDRREAEGIRVARESRERAEADLRKMRREAGHDAALAMRLRRIREENGLAHAINVLFSGARQEGS